MTKRWYLNGQLSYRSGARDTEKRQWYDDGTPYSSCKFVPDRGFIWSSWYRDGSLMQTIETIKKQLVTTNYSKDQRIITTSYHESGELISVKKLDTLTGLESETWSREWNTP